MGKHSMGFFGLSDRNSGLVLEEFLEGSHMVFDQEGGEEWTVLEYPEAEAAEGHGRQGRVQGTDKVFVKPLCLLNLEADTRN